MLIGVNTLSLTAHQGGGEELYLRRVLAKMRELQPSTRFLLFTDAENHDSFAGWERFCLSEAETRRGRSGRPEQLLYEAAVGAGADLVFTHLSGVPEKPPLPVVPYVMDLSPWEQSETSRRRFASKKPRHPKYTNALSVVVAPSRYIRENLLRVLDIPMDKVVVAPLGVDDVFAISQPGVVEEPYILAVGRTRQTKNIPVLMEAFHKLEEEHPHNLVVVGAPGDAEPEDWGPHVLRIDRCPATQLAGLYQHSAVCVCASLYEGSGVTVLEAMRAGTRVTAGRVGGIPEVAGSAPIFCNPESAKSLVGAMRRAVTESDDERERQAKLGQQLAAEFTWEQCAWKTLSAFKRA